MQEILAFNKRFYSGEVTWKKGINKFTAMTFDEISDYYKLIKVQE